VDSAASRGGGEVARAVGVVTQPQRVTPGQAVHTVLAPSPTRSTEAVQH